MTDGAPMKTCVICGEDCSAHPRVKDAHGHYYCKVCHDSAMARQHSAGHDAAAHGHAGHIVPAPVQAPPDLTAVHAPPAHGSAGYELESAETPQVIFVTSDRAPPQYALHPGHDPSSAGAVPPMPGQPMFRSEWPTVIGITSIVLAGLGAIFNLVSMVFQFAVEPMPSDPAERIVGIIGGGIAAVITIGLSVWLGVSGVFLLRRRRGGAISLKAWAWTKLAIYGTCMLCIGAILPFVPLAEIDPEMAGIPIAFFLVVWFVVMLWFLLWPAFVLIWTFRRRIRDEIATW